jgi:hypothetical protein
MSLRLTYGAGVYAIGIGATFPNGYLNRGECTSRRSSAALRSRQESLARTGVETGMVTNERYLHFDNIDMEEPYISSRCSRCGQEFRHRTQARRTSR